MSFSCLLEATLQDRYGNLLHYKQVDFRVAPENDILRFSPKTANGKMGAQKLVLQNGLNLAHRCKFPLARKLERLVQRREGGDVHTLPVFS